MSNHDVERSVESPAPGLVAAASEVSPQDAVMTEIVLPGIVEPDGLLVRHRSIPVAGRGQAVVRMLATGVSFGEQSMRRGRYPGQPKFPFVPGYDLVGTVTAVGDRVDAGVLGQRVAAVTKTGGWATYAKLDARTLVPVPAELDPAVVETFLLNGITAWQMLHRKARVRAGQTVLVHGVNGGVGYVLAQLAIDAGARVVGTASPRHFDALRGLGVEPVDYGDPDLSARVRELAPDGLDAVFDHLGGASFDRSFALLRRGGALIGYGTASRRDDTSGAIGMFAGIVAQFTAWTVLPNGKRAVFYNFWGGKLIRPEAFRRRLAADLTSVLALVVRGTISARIADRIPLEQTGRALALAESGSVSGKVVIVP